VIGHARHGKDTVAEILRDRYGKRFQSSSGFCTEKVMMPFFASAGRPYSSAEECFADRGNHRAAWFAQIAAYNREDPARLARELFGAGNDIYVGMRNAAELEAARKLADLVVWVDASERCPPEPPSSCSVTREMADVCIPNNASLAALAEAVALFAAEHLRDGRIAGPGILAGHPIGILMGSAAPRAPSSGAAAFEGRSTKGTQGADRSHTPGDGAAAGLAPSGVSSAEEIDRNRTPATPPGTVAQSDPSSASWEWELQGIKPIWAKLPGCDYPREPSEVQCGECRAGCPMHLRQCRAARRRGPRIEEVD
jgi:hypothetical protein